MFDFDPNTIYVAKILAVYFFGLISGVGLVVFAVALYEVKHGQTDTAQKIHEQELNTDLDHIDIALKDNLYTLA